MKKEIKEKNQGNSNTGDSVLITRVQSKNIEKQIMNDQKGRSCSTELKIISAKKINENKQNEITQNANIKSDLNF